MSAGPAAAQWRNWDADFDDDSTPWKEIEARIPSYPRSEDLVVFEVSASKAHRYYIDARSLSIGEDGVVRYTLVVKAAGGATNVTFEGIRCELREQKYYAVGRPDGNCARARNPRWRAIQSHELNLHHGVLYRDFLCPDKRPAASASEALRLLKYGLPAAGG